MQISDLLHSLTLQGFTIGTVGCESIEVRGRIERLTPDVKRALRKHKPALLRMLCPKPSEPFPAEAMLARRSTRVSWATDDASYEQHEREAIQHEHELPYSPFITNEYYDDCQANWNRATKADREYMAAAPPQSRCRWCSGIAHHNPNCFGLPRMPWGKYKTMPLSVVPERYLSFVLKRGYGRTEHRRTILDELQRRFARYQDANWERLIHDGGDASRYDERIASGRQPQGDSDHNNPLTWKGPVMASANSNVVAIPQVSKGDA